MINKTQTPLRSASLVADNGYIVDVTFKADGHISDLSVFDKDNEIVFSDSVETAIELAEAIEFVTNYPFPKGE